MVRRATRQVSAAGVRNELCDNEAALLFFPQWDTASSSCHPEGLKWIAVSLCCRSWVSQRARPATCPPRVLPAPRATPPPVMWPSRSPRLPRPTSSAAFPCWSTTSSPVTRIRCIPERPRAIAPTSRRPTSAAIGQSTSRRCSTRTSVMCRLACRPWCSCSMMRRTHSSATSTRTGSSRSTPRAPLASGWTLPRPIPAGRTAACSACSTAAPPGTTFSAMAPSSAARRRSGDS